MERAAVVFGRAELVSVWFVRRVEGGDGRIVARLTCSTAACRCSTSIGPEGHIWLSLSMPGRLVRRSYPQGRPCVVMAAHLSKRVAGIAAVILAQRQYLVL